MDDNLFTQLGSNIIQTNITNRFLKKVYYFYYYKGYKAKVIANLIEIISLVFGIIFSVFFFILIDWNNLLQCNDEKTCKPFSQYIIYREINIFQFGIIFLSFLYLISKIINFYPELSDLLLIRDFYESELEIKTDEIYNIPWETILKTINDKCLTVDKYDLTSKIMIEENYMIALIDKKVLKIPKFLFTKQLLLNLENILYDELENINEKMLKRKFIVYGLINLLFLPFILTFHIIYFFINNIEDFYFNKSVLGPRRYTELAKLKFREYNELPHYFEDRINKSFKYSNEYVRQFETPILESICKFFIVICGSLFSLFLFMSVLDENILLYVKVFDRSLIFYTGIVSAVSGFAKTYIRGPENSIFNPDEVMDKIVKYTYYFPKRWQGRCNRREIRDEFLSFFPYKINIFFYDIISAICIPYYMLYTLPRQTTEIVNFIKINTIEQDNIGKMCIFSQKHQDFEDDKMKSSLIHFREKFIESEFI